MMINVLFFTCIEKYVVAMRCYGYCSLVSEGIKPDMFDINREMPTTLAAPCLPRLERVDSLSVPVLNVQFVPVFILYIKSAQNSIRRIPA